MTFSGRVALVTGASQGIGRACALKLAQSEATLALAARSQEKLQELVQQIEAAGGKAAAFPLDVGDEEQIKSAFKAVIAQFGKIDILVNNAGITRDLSLYSAGDQFDVEAALGPDHQHHFDFWTNRSGRTGELRGFEGGVDWTDHGHRPRSGITQHYL